MGGPTGWGDFRTASRRALTLSVTHAVTGGERIESETPERGRSEKIRVTGALDEFRV
jgi:hypothetical protein